MRIYNERPIVKLNPGLASDCVFMFLSLLAFVSVFIGVQALFFWWSH